MYLEKQYIDSSGFNVYVRKKKEKMAFWLTSPQLPRCKVLMQNLCALHEHFL